MTPLARWALAATVAAASALIPAAAPAAVPGSTLWGSVPSGFGPFPAQDVNDSGGYNDMDRPGHLGASASGRYVVFASQSDGLSAEDDNRVNNIFVRDRTTGATTLVSRASGAAGAAGDGDSNDPTISDDGRFVAFSSHATNLAAQDTNTFTDIFVRDLQTGSTILISAVGGGSPVTSDGDSYEPVISGDGTTVAFESAATNLDGLLNPDTSADFDIYRRAITGTQPALISRAAGALGVKGNGTSYQPAISDDGTVIAFTSEASNLDAADTDTTDDVYQRDVGPVAPTTKLVSRATGLGGAAADSFAAAPAMDGTGDTIAFASGATNLSPADPSTGTDVYLRRVTSGTTTLVSRADGAAGTVLNDAQTPAVSDDGARVAFTSQSAAIAPVNTTQLVQRTVGTNATTIVSSIGSAATPLFGALRPLYVGASGTIVFSAAGPLIPDTDGIFTSVYLRDPGAVPQLVSRPTGSAPVVTRMSTGNTGFEPWSRSLSADGRYLVFQTRSPAITGVAAEAMQIVRRDLLTGESLVVSRATGASGALANDYAYDASISADGNRIVFASGSDNLDPADTDGDNDIFVRDVSAATTTLASRASGTGGAAADSDAYLPAIAQDGSAVTFTSSAVNLVAGDGNGTNDVFVRRLADATTTLASRADGPAGAVGNNGGFGADISADGRRVAFVSSSSNLGDGDADAFSDVHVRDLAAGTTVLASRADGAAGAKATGDSPAISGDGRVVLFQSNAASLNLPLGTQPQVWARDLVAGTTKLVSTTAAGGPADSSATPGGLNTDGSLITFASSAPNLGVSGSTIFGVFVRRMTSPGAELISRADGPAGVPIRAGSAPSISADGTCVAFTGRGSPTAVPGVSPDFDQVFVRVLSSECPKDPPETTITSGPTGKAASSTVAFGFASDEANSTFECRVNGGAFAACTSPLTRTKLPDGPFSFEVRATDPAGFTDPTPASRTVTVGVPPVIKAFTLSPGRFRVGRDATAVSAAAKRSGGTTLRIALSEQARVRIVLARSLPGRRVGKSCRKPTRKLRSRKRCTRAVRAGTLTRRAKGTKLTLRFSGRVGRKALPVGRYTATATATDAGGNVSKPRARSFSVTG